MEKGLDAHSRVRIIYLVAAGAWLLLVDLVLLSAVGHRVPQPMGVAGSWSFVAASAALLLLATFVPVSRAQTVPAPTAGTGAVQGIPNATPVASTPSGLVVLITSVRRSGAWMPEIRAALPRRKADTPLMLP